MMESSSTTHHKHDVLCMLSSSIILVFRITDCMRSEEVNMKSYQLTAETDFDPDSCHANKEPKVG